MADQGMNFIALLGGFLRGAMQRSMFQQEQETKKEIGAKNQVQPMMELYSNLIGDKDLPPETRKQAFEQYSRMAGAKEIPQMEFGQPAKSVAQMAMEDPEKSLGLYQKAFGEGGPFYEAPKQAEPLDALSEAKIKREEAETYAANQLGNLRKAQAAGETESSKYPDWLKSVQTELKDKYKTILGSIDANLISLRNMQGNYLISKPIRDGLATQVKQLEDERNSVLGKIHDIDFTPAEIFLKKMYEEAGMPYPGPTTQPPPADTTRIPRVNTAGFPGTVGGQALPFPGKKPKYGDIEDGYMYIGGLNDDPGDSTKWRKVSGK